MRVLAIAAAVFTLLVCALPARSAPRSWRPERGWIRDALCIHEHESVRWDRAGVDWLGRPSPYYGGMQFLLATWRSAGGRGLPSNASPREQLYRAWVVWKRDGRSWREWGTRHRCGLS